jgi:alpha-ketoglutarate-dependent taurine dioxygenase
MGADTRIESAIAWRREDLESATWLIEADDGVLEELDALAESLPESIEIETIESSRFDLPRTRSLMAGITQRLSADTGFAVLDGLPFERWGERGASAVSWVLCDLVCPPVMQKWTGTRMYAVRNTGAQLGYGVRRSLTNLKQDLHTDGPWLGATPNFMALSCVRQAAEGGVSRITSLAAAHDALSKSAPELLSRLYEPFYWDRQAEHAKGDVPVSFLPVYRSGPNGVHAGYYDDYIRNGYKLANARLDERGEEALRVLRDFVESPENCFEFRLKQGQIFFLNNHLVAHGRSAFTDSGESDRLLLRLWLRESGGIGFEPRKA